MHLVIVTLVKLLRERTVLVRAVSEEGGRAYGDHGDDDEQDDNWHRHASIVYAIAQKDEFDMKNSAFPHVISKNENNGVSVCFRH